MLVVQQNKHTVLTAFSPYVEAAAALLALKVESSPSKGQESGVQKWSLPLIPDRELSSIRMPLWLWGDNSPDLFNWKNSMPTYQQDAK